MTALTTDGMVTVGDIDVAYTEAGAGRPVVLVHGLAEDRGSWLAQQLELPDVRTFAYDLRGHGRTSLGMPDATLAQLGEDLVGFLEQLTGPATVVGFSLGGTIALWAAAERPELVAHVIVLGTSSIVGRAAAEFYADRIAKSADTAVDTFRDALRNDTAAALTVARDRLDEVLDARLRAVGDGRGYANAAAAMAALRTSPLTPRLADVRAHVDVVGAADDSFCPPKAAAILVDALLDVTLHEIPNAGHLMNIDQPAAVTATLRAVLTERT
jgi:3-oxoadipate enol-lactonase